MTCIGYVFGATQVNIAYTQTVISNLKTEFNKLKIKIYI